MAGNQVGKCATISSYLTLADGTRRTYGELYAAGLPFEVMAWDGARVIKALAVQPIKKPAEPCVRLWFADGQWIEVALRHRLLAADGTYVFCEHLLKSLPCLPASNSGLSRLGRLSGVPRWTGKLQGFLSGCLAGFRFCDERLRGPANSALAVVRRPAGVLQRSFLWSGSGGYSSICASSHRLGSGRLSSLYAMDRIAGRCAAFGSQAVYRSARYTTRLLQAAQRLAVGLAVRLQSRSVVEHGQSEAGALLNPYGLAKDGNQIVAYQLIASQEVYDFTVPETSNYIACGVVHHNTVAGGAEWAMHLTGRYPDWWQGQTFDKPVILWASGVTGESTRDNPQRILIGNPPREEQWGTGMVPKDALIDYDRAMGVPNLLDNYVIRHGGGGDTQAGESIVYFKAYEKGREKWQGPTIDGCWWDEEPPQDIYTEGLTRTNNGQRGQFGMITFTPLLGMSEVVSLFLIDGK